MKIFRDVINTYKKGIYSEPMVTAGQLFLAIKQFYDESPYSEELRELAIKKEVTVGFNLGERTLYLIPLSSLGDIIKEVNNGGYNIDAQDIVGFVFDTWQEQMYGI